MNHNIKAGNIVSKVMFIYIDCYRRKRRMIINMDMPKFKEQIVPGFDGSISVEEQIMEYLDTIDKSDIMAKYDMYEIITYFPYKKKKKRMSEKESFFNFLNTQKVVYNLDEKTMADIVAYASASKTIFGHRKSNEQKIQEIADNLTIFAKVRDNMLNMIFKKFNLYFKENMTNEEKEEYCQLQDKFLYSDQYPVIDSYKLFN